MDEHVFKVGDRVRFYKYTGTVVYARPPMRYLRGWSYHVRMDGDPVYCRTTDLQRTAIGVYGWELEELIDAAR